MDGYGRLDGISPPGRLAGPAEGITLEELALAARNHGLPLEALRYEVTPPGLHYVLVHYDIPAARAEDWRLTVDGRVRTPLALDLASLRSFPAVTHRVTMECAGNGRARLDPRPVSQPWLVEAVGTAEWTGVPLRLLLAEAGVGADAVEAVFGGADHGVERGVEQDYRRSLPLGVAAGRDPEVLVAYGMNGGPLPPQHGFPLRLVVPGWYGMASVKWLTGIRLTAAPFTGFQQAEGYRYRREADDPGEPVTRIAPRALMIPPGFPDFMSRTRVVRPGEVLLEGRAWSGHAPVTRVEVSTDGGGTWSEAVLTGPEGHGTPHPWAWRGWQARWTAAPGSHVLGVRATDATGAGQPVLQRWNRGGFGSNHVQRIAVLCTPESG
ncbi:molybdopterin-dependent oxidoreductase [Streptomyces finlayi]|uniref:Molybdopterin-dependent oxidoreductase n=1 Tax=Streptomyces finlayi TaxID=67296 RepID=A0A7G7BKV5_9ACTN|nr:sulfite oxidase [Streptomyces finlayi]QNE75970.1 molybdopterin-dependent oxidoreductase [Streptomyces finlayi]